MALPALGAELPARPEGRVSDYANVLGQSQGALERRLEAFERRTGHQAAVAIFPNLGGEAVEDFAVALFKKWGLGQAKQNDGVLLVIGIQEHALRIEVGYGLEGDLPDAMAGQIVRQRIVPHLKQDDFAGAVGAYAASLEELFVDGRPPVDMRRTRRGGELSPIQTLVLIVLILIIVFVIRAFQAAQSLLTGRGMYRRSGWGGGWTQSSGWGRSSSSGWGSGGGFGGGGFSGGGGMSGGGGASGRW